MTSGDRRETRARTMAAARACLIIAAGRGMRLARRGAAKPLVQLLQVPLLDRIVASAAEAGLEEFYVVTGHERRRVEEHVADLARRTGLSVHTIHSPDWESGNGASVLRGEEVIEEPFVLLMADHIFEPGILSDLRRCQLDEGEVRLVVDYDLSPTDRIDIDDVTKVRVQDGRIRQIGKDLADYNAYDTGIFLCSRRLFAALRRVRGSLPQLSLSQGIQHLAQEGRVRAHDVGGRFWIDVDDEAMLGVAENWLRARPG